MTRCDYCGRRIRKREREGAVVDLRRVRDWQDIRPGEVRRFTEFPLVGLDDDDRVEIQAARARGLRGRDLIRWARSVGIRLCTFHADCAKQAAP
jgi:hypothetical protein